MIEELLGGKADGRHALDEDAVHTPIFAALTLGARQQERTRSAGPSEVSLREVSLAEFRRDPLTAPFPVQLVGAAPAPPTVTGGVIVDMAAGGAHRRGSAARPRAARGRSAAREWAGLDALADTGRHHLKQVANW